MPQCFEHNGQPQIRILAYFISMPTLNNTDISSVFTRYVWAIVFLTNLIHLQFLEIVLRETQNQIISNISLYSLYYAEACNEFAGPISESLRPGRTAPFE